MNIGPDVFSRKLVLVLVVTLILFSFLYFFEFSIMKEIEDRQFGSENSGTSERVPSINSSYQGLDDRSLEKRIYTKVNDHRKSKGLQPFVYSELVEAIARVHSKDMAERDFIAHKNPDGEWSGDRHSRYNGCNITNEIIFQGDIYHLDTPDKVAELVIDTWKDSEPHYEVMMTEWSQVSGVGVYITEGGTLYATQNFCRNHPSS